MEGTKGEGVWFCHSDEPQETHPTTHTNIHTPPSLGKRQLEERAEMLTFGKGPLASDRVMESAASVKHLY